MAFNLNKPLGKGNGLTAGFGTLIGPERLGQFRADGWSYVRNGSLTGPPELLQSFVAEIQRAGLEPVIGELMARQVPTLPFSGLKVELRGTLPPGSRDPDGGASHEPGEYADPAVEAAALNAIAPFVKLKKLQAYVGMVGLDEGRAGLPFLEGLLKTLDPIFGISVHRYPPKNPTSWAASTNQSRAYEVFRLRQLIGWRPWAVCECGYNQGPSSTFWERLRGRHHHLTDAQQEQCLYDELRWWSACGADFCIVFQENDGPERCVRRGCPNPGYYSLDGSGIRKQPGGQWKPSAKLGATDGRIPDVRLTKEKQR